MVALALGPGICGFAEVWNELCDFRCGARCTPKLFLGCSLAGGTGIISQHGSVEMRLASVLALASVLVAVIAGALLTPSALSLVVVGLVLAWSYSARPVRAKRRSGWGLLVQALGYGPIAFCLGAFAVDHLPTTVEMIAAMLIGAWVATVGMLTDILDVEEDRRCGVRTLAAVIGRPWAEVYLASGGTLVLFSAVLLLSMGGGSLNLAGAGVIVGFGSLTYILFRFRHRSIPTATHALVLLLEFIFPFAVMGV